MDKGMRELLNEVRLRPLNILYIERRRLHGDPILGHNIFRDRLDVLQAVFLEAAADRDLLGHKFKLRHCSFVFAPKENSLLVGAFHLWKWLSQRRTWEFSSIRPSSHCYNVRRHTLVPELPSS